MAAIGSCWAQPSWADDVWADGTWAGSVTPPTPVVVAPPAGGGRRLRNEDDEKKRVKTRPLTRQERRELDRLFRDDTPAPVAAPREATPAAPAPLPVPQSAPAVTPTAWVEKARHVAALDAIGEYLQRVPRTVGDDSRRRAYQRAVEAAQRAEQEQQNRVLQLAAEQDRIQQAATAAEQERQRQADEDEMIAVLLAIHELS